MSLSGGEYAQRRAECETAAKILGVPFFARCDAGAAGTCKKQNARSRFLSRAPRHRRNRTHDSRAEGIRNSNWPAVGQFMYASHYSLRDDYEVSCKELDAVVEIAEAIGVKGGIFGCRMTGGGFGGCAVALVKTESVEAISQKIAADYKTKTGIEATIFVSRPAAGATVLRGAVSVNRPGKFRRAGRFQPKDGRAKRFCVFRRLFRAARVRCRHRAQPPSRQKLPH